MNDLLLDIAEFAFSILFECVFLCSCAFM